MLLILCKDRVQRCFPRNECAGRHQALDCFSKAQNFVFRVRLAVMRHLPGGNTRMSAVALDLGMSERTLARRLAAQGQSFRALVDQVRQELSFQYLKNKDLEIKEIAYRLGYSQVAAFNHAFRRWTGLTPTQFRR